MRIALHISNLDPGGAQNVMLRIAGELNGRGHHVTLMPNRASGFWRSSMPEGIELVELGASTLIDAVPRLVSALRSARSEVLLAAMTQANISAVAASKLARIPVVICERHACSAWMSELRSHKRMVYRRVLPAAYRRADGIVAQTEAAARDLSAVINVDPARISVIANPGPETQPDPVEAPHPYFELGDPVIVGVGRLVPQKNFSLLLNAFARLPRSGYARLIILGEGPLAEELADQAEQLGIDDRVCFAGQVDNVHAYLSHAALYAQSSNYEGFPNALLEALAAGTPVVATDCPTGARELLLDGALGELVPVADAGAMAQAIERVLAAPGPAAPRRARAQDFTLSSITDAFEVLLTEAVNE